MTKLHTYIPWNFLLNCEHTLYVAIHMYNYVGFDSFESTFNNSVATAICS